MTTIVTTIAQDVTAANFAEAVETGRVRFYRVRANGSTRHVPFLPEGSEQRMLAEWIVEQRDEGRTMKSIATEALLSVPSVRRLINSLLLTEEVEDYDEEDIAEILASAEVDAEEAQAAEAKAEEAAERLYAKAETQPAEAQPTEEPVAAASTEASADAVVA
jgi:hypothetical protein